MSERNFRRLLPLLILPVLYLFFSFAYHPLPTKQPATTETVDAVLYANYPRGQLPGYFNNSGIHDIVVVLRTGATQAFSRLPIQLASLFPHIPNYLLFSDYEDWIAGYHIQDGLANVSPELRLHHEDFVLWREQRRLLPMAQAPEDVSLEGGWALDKYKFMPVVYQTWRQRPEAKWIFLGDDDTYFVMANLVDFVAGLDHTVPFFLGSFGTPGLAHGGAGVILSQAALQYLFTRSPDLAGVETEKTARDDTKFGDALLSYHLTKEGIPFYPIPGLQGNPQAQIVLHPDQFCEPILSLHHLNSRLIAAMWEFERQAARPGEYIRYRDVFDHFTYPHLVPDRPHWDSFRGVGNGVVVEGETSVEGCREACSRTPKCMQFRVKGGECRITDHIILGNHDRPHTKAEEIAHSGWMMDRIEAVRSNHVCGPLQPGWQKQQLTSSDQPA